MSFDYQLRPLSTADADTLRASGGPTYVTDEFPGYPCRHCLLDAQVGEALILTSHDPFTVTSPYRSASPIFIHRHECAPPDSQASLPRQLTGRQLSVRAFDVNEMMIDADVIDGRRLHDTIQRFFGADEADHIHVHNASRGCWATSVVRAN